MRQCSPLGSNLRSRLEAAGWLARHQNRTEQGYNISSTTLKNGRIIGWLLFHVSVFLPALIWFV
ncbi:hypothetical protein BDW66DRAFT_36399 [Aspergillus desertorum]